LKAETKTLNINTNKYEQYIHGWKEDDYRNQEMKRALMSWRKTQDKKERKSDETDLCYILFYVI
jgi:hypothetical protein